MKKFLLSCFIALGIGANAQYNYVGNFEGDTTLYGQFGSGTITAAAACNGSFGGQLAPSTTYTQTGWMLQLDLLQDAVPTQTNNSQHATVTVKYKKAAGAVGTIQPMLFTYNDVADTWSLTSIGTPVSLATAAITTCASVTGNIPAGLMEQGKTYAVGAWYIRTSGSGNVYMDDISIVQDVVTTAPACSAITSPANGAVISAGQPTITWAAAPTAVNYKLTIGTTSGSGNVFNGTVTGSTSYSFPAAVNTTYYAKVVPSNLSGDATGCSEITFSTNGTVAYCTSTGPASAQYDKITNVAFANINQASPGSVTPYPPGYEDFTTVVGNVTKGTSYNLVVKSDRVYSGDVIRAFIDYNGNGNFSDSGELVATIPVTATSTAYTSATQSIAIPAAAATGNTRMRVLIYDGGDTFSATMPTTSCGTAAYGQVEDYTLNISPSLAVSDVNKTGVSVYPNPFTDVLKISDVKGVKSVSVNDVSGRVVKYLTPSAELNLSSLKSGLYIVNLKMEDGSVKSFKAIKK